MKRLWILTSLVCFLLLPELRASGVPRPEEVFGFRPGDDYKLADYSQMTEYFRRLGASSDRIKVLEIGPTAMGRTMILAVISSEENLARLEEYRSISEKLARARIGSEEARRLAAEGRAIVWIDCGLHATEVAHAQHAPELAYRVVTEESDEMRLVRENAILLHVPVMNPDGLDLVVEWYRKNLGTDFETSPLPVLYHKYAGHDNNRDWYMMTQPETRNVSRILYHEWYPQIVYNHHQTAPFPARIFIPPFAPPMNPHIPPLVMRGIDLVGNAMAARFEAEGKPGAISRITFNTWWNGGMRTTPYFHNMVGILTETALYRYATPHEYKPESLPATFANGWPTLEPTPDYPNPWKGGWWRLRDAMDYMMTASLAVLDVGARYRGQWLFNIYQMGRWAIEAGEAGSPFAYLVPPDQHDPSAAVEMLRILALGGLEVHQAETAFEVDETAYPAGTPILFAAQSFRPYLLDLMEPQRYPDRRLYPGGPPERPYDIAGWTLPLQMGVRTVRVENPFSVQARQMEEIRLPQPPEPDSGAVYFIDRRWNQAYRLANRLLSQGVPVRVSPEAVELADSTLPPGSFAVGGDFAEPLKRLARELRIPLHAAPARPRDLEDLRLPRVGLYKSWVANMDEGWTRWLLEQYAFPFENVFDAEIRAANLGRRFDVLILPSQAVTSMLRGHAPGSIPEPYSGGLGIEGFLEIKEFVEEGGLLVAMDAASELPIRYFVLPLRNVLGGVASSEFFCPGSLLRLNVDPSDPLGYGMNSEAAAFFVNSQAFDLGSGGEGEEGDGDEAAQAQPGVSVAEYSRLNLLMSGWILGEDRAGGRTAVARLPLGKGQVVLLGFRTQFRGQPHGTFKLLFNSIYLGGTKDAS